MDAFQELDWSANYAKMVTSLLTVAVILKTVLNGTKESAWFVKKASATATENAFRISKWYQVESDLYIW